MSTKIIRRNHYVPETVQERKTQAEHLKLLTIKSQVITHCLLFVFS
jgi:hypothetical protein